MMDKMYFIGIKYFMVDKMYFIGIKYFMVDKMFYIFIYSDKFGKNPLW